MQMQKSDPNQTLAIYLHLINAVDKILLDKMLMFVRILYIKDCVDP